MASNAPIVSPVRHVQNPGDYWIDNIEQGTAGFYPASSRGPSFANILQPKDASTAPEIVDGQTSAKKRSRQRGQVHPRIHPDDWEKYKDYLKNLYIKKRETTLQIKDHMKRDFNFDAS
jgi:hypothetical protein